MASAWTPETVISITALFLTIAASIYKAGQLEAKFDAKIQDLRNYVDKSGISEGATNARIELKLNYLEKNTELRFKDVSGSMEKELSERTREQRILKAKVAQIENFLGKTTSFIRRDTEK